MSLKIACSSERFQRKFGSFQSKILTHFHGPLNQTSKFKFLPFHVPKLANEHTFNDGRQSSPWPCFPVGFLSDRTPEFWKYISLKIERPKDKSSAQIQLKRKLGIEKAIQSFELTQTKLWKKDFPGSKILNRSHQLWP